MSDFYDPYNDNQDPYGVDEWMYTLMASPQWSAQVNPLPGSTLAQDRAWLNDLQKQTGLQLVPLLTGQTQPVAPFQSETKAMYGANPMYGKLIEAIDSGNDPDTAVAGVASEFGVSLSDPAVAERLTGIADSYAREKFQYNQQAQGPQGMNKFTANGKTYEGSPDVMGFANEHELMGSPTAQGLSQDLLRQYASKNRSARPAARPEDVIRGVVNRAAGAFGGGPKEAVGGGVSKEVQDAIGRVAAMRVAKAKTTNVRSDANRDAMQKVLTHRALYGV